MVGIDIVEIDRFRNMENLPELTKRICTGQEEAYIKNEENLAGIFAAKEAVAKALRIGLAKMTLKGCEIFHEENGAPYAVLYGEAKRVLGNRKLHISISHTRSLAVAIAVLL